MGPARRGCGSRRFGGPRRCLFLRGLSVPHRRVAVVEEVAADSTCREAHFYLGESAREKKNFDEAAKHYERAVLSTPGVLSYVDQLSALQNLGVVRLELGELDLARVSFRAALAITADDEHRRRLTHNLATAELKAGQAGEAARLLEPEAARPDPYPASLLIRARALGKLGRTEEATLLVQRLKGLAPRHAE